jgi:hypothetical protein
MFPLEHAQLKIQNKCKNNTNYGQNYQNKNMAVIFNCKYTDSNQLTLSLLGPKGLGRTRRLTQF